MKVTKLEFVEAVTDEQLHRLADLANEIWHEFFPGIITEEQIDYMLEKFQSFDAMKRQIAEEGYHYKMLFFDGVPLGYLQKARWLAFSLEALSQKQCARQGSCFHHVERNKAHRPPRGLRDYLAHRK